MDEQDSSADARLIPWETFSSTFLHPPLGADVPVDGTPRLMIFVEPGGARLGMRIPGFGGDPPDPGLRSVQLQRIGENLVVSTVDNQLFQAFYALLLDVSDRIQLQGTPAMDAINDALRVWRRLLAGLGGLTHEEQLGLTGELWALLRLMQSCGAEAVDSWTGPAREAHDFRLNADEMEVKTTSGQQRRHQISRLDQLEPSPGKRLHILSIQVARAGAGEGWTLGEQVEEVRKRIGADVGHRDRFGRLLSLVRWHDQDVGLYPDRWQLRTTPTVIRVDDGCPRITPPVVTAGIGPLATRIDDVSYRVNLEGLGREDGTEPFLALLPRP